jgi:uncharacterized protein (DUF2336 family)
MQLSEQSVIEELEEAVRKGSSDKRITALRRVTDLLLHDGDRLSEDQIEVFDQVLCRLIERVETRVCVELSRRVARVDFAPIEVIQRLAKDDSIEVAGEVLSHSRRLTIETLVNVANSNGQDHLFAISGRADLPEAVTDIIVTRGDRRVIRNLAENTTAKFSENGYGRMVEHAGADDELTEILGLRVDLPIKYLRDLLQRATDAVRARLMAKAPAELQEEIGRVLTAIKEQVTGKAAPARDFTLAEAAVKRMKGMNELNDKAIVAFVKAKNFNNVAAALGLLSSANTELVARVIDGPRHDLVLIPCKAAGLSWDTTQVILLSRPIKHAIGETTLKVAEKDFGRLSMETAQRTLRFWQVHDKIGG